MKTKYESVIHFNYELNSDELVLSEQFKGDLTSAAAKFVGNYGDATITLNDYSNVIPFKIEIPKDESNVVYIGMPNLKNQLIFQEKLQLICYLIREICLSLQMKLLTIFVKGLLIL